MVDGVALNSSFPLATIRDACTSLGLGRSGGKMKCLERLKKHLESQQLAAQHSAEIQLRKDDQRKREIATTCINPMLHGVKFVLQIEADKMGAEHIPNLLQVLQWCLLTSDILAGLRLKMIPNC